MLTVRESEERLQRALDATGLCLWDFDVPSGDVYLSEAWSIRLGGNVATTRTTLADLAELVPASERPGLLDALHAALKSPDALYRVEHRVRKLDGTMSWNLSEGKVVERDAQGRAVRMVGTNRDITPAKEAEALQRDLELQLRESQRMEAIGTLASGIAHDFNNILGAVLGNLALARDDVGVGHPALASLEQNNKAALRARKLVRQILAFGRHQPFERSVRPLAPIVEESVAMLRASLPTAVDLFVSLGEEALNVRMDSTQMQQVLVNLCTNAWHAMSERAGGSISPWNGSNPFAELPRATRR